MGLEENCFEGNSRNQSYYLLLQVQCWWIWRVASWLMRVLEAGEEFHYRLLLAMELSSE